MNYKYFYPLLLLSTIFAQASQKENQYLSCTKLPLELQNIVENYFFDFKKSISDVNSDYDNVYYLNFLKAKLTKENVNELKKLNENCKHQLSINLKYFCQVFLWVDLIKIMSYVLLYYQPAPILSKLLGFFALNAGAYLIYRELGVSSKLDFDKFCANVSAYFERRKIGLLLKDL